LGWKNLGSEFWLHREPARMLFLVLEPSPLTPSSLQPIFLWGLAQALLPALEHRAPLAQHSSSELHVCISPD
jgi:hypothetical protein